MAETIGTLAFNLNGETSNVTVFLGKTCAKIAPDLFGVKMKRTLRGMAMIATIYPSERRKEDGLKDEHALAADGTLARNEDGGESGI